MIIEIEDLTFNTIIGLLDFERVTPQKVIINIRIEYKYQNNIFINYADIVKLVEEKVKNEKFKLLEDALISIKNFLFNKYENIDKLYIKISKPTILNNAIVSLSNYWENQ